MGEACCVMLSRLPWNETRRLWPSGWPRCLGARGNTGRLGLAAGLAAWARAEAPLPPGRPPAAACRDLGRRGRALAWARVSQRERHRPCEQKTVRSTWTEKEEEGN